LASFAFDTDAFQFDAAVFGTGATRSFLNTPASGLPAGGANVIVL